MSSKYDDLVKTETAKLSKQFEGNDEELRKELSKNELGHLPMTCQTRPMLIKRLATKRIDIVAKDESSPDYEKQETCSKDLEKLDNISVSTESSISVDDPNKTHYVICIPGAINQILIESDRLEVLKKMKDHTKKKPRMLMFPNYAQAAEFAQRTSANDVCQGAIVKTNYPTEKAERDINESGPFPSIGVPQSNQLRILLEKGNINVAQQLILTNARYLISTGDVPSILKIGPRYNALHVCAFVGQLESCRLILDLLCDIDFLQTMYGTRKRAEEYSKRLLDLYLNTPDKYASKTPLHFASEKGFVDIVALLVSFRACNRMTKHQQIACDKYNGPDKAQLQMRIQNLIKDGTCYVPLVRSDTTGPYAKVVEPFSPSSPSHLVEEIEENLKPNHLNDSSLEMKDFSNLKLWAVAGPMSPHEAQEFRRDWWSPRTRRRKENHPQEPFLNVTDAERGFEHYGRKLADSHDIPWQEYWPFLDSFVDMRSLEGLSKLEVYISKQNVIIKYNTFHTQGIPISSEPFQISQNFVAEATNDNDDSDSFVSASEFSNVPREDTRFVSASDISNVVQEDGERLSEKQVHSATEKVGGDDGTDFYDCNQSVLEVDHSNTGQKSDDGESSFQKIWNGLGLIKGLFSPASRRSSPSTGNISPSSIILPSSPSLSPPHNKLSLSHLADSSTDRLSKGSSENILSSTVQSDIRELKSSSTNTENSEVTSSSLLRSLNQDLEFSAVSEILSLKASEDKEQRPSDCNDSNSAGTRFTDKIKRQLPLTSTPVNEWKYRNSVPIISSPDEPSNVSREVDIVNDDEEKDVPIVEKEMPSQTSRNDNNCAVGAKENSFGKDMSLLCQGLEKFKFQSPPNSSPAETCILDTSEESLTQKLLALQIFAEINVPMFMAEVESKLHRPESDVKTTVKPVLILRQADDYDDIILGDIYLPVGNVPLDLDLVADETLRKEMQTNVWLNFLVSFPFSSDAKSIAALNSYEMVDVEVVGVPATRCSVLAREKEFDLARLKEAYRNSCNTVAGSCPEKESNSAVLQCKVVRASSILTKDVYICGTVPTKMDGDVYRALNEKAIEIIENTQELSSVRNWFNRMKINGKDIENLPSPSRIMRSSLQRQGSLPLSPLVKSDRPIQSTMMQSPSTSRKPNKDLIIRKLFQNK